MPLEKAANPWTTRGSKLVYENNWISVRQDDVLCPDGSPSIYGVVQFKNLAVGVLAIDADDNVCLVGQFRYPLQEYSWEIPEGGCPHGEEPLNAAKRELAEETGLSAARWEKLGESRLSNSVSDEHAFWFLATGLTQGVAQPDATEDLTMAKIPFKQALDMVLSGEINDSLSQLAIMSYAVRRQQSLTEL